MEKPQELADIQTLDRSFRLLDTNIYLVLMRRADGAKSLSVTVDDATAAIVLLDGKTVNWTIYEGDWGHSVQRLIRLANSWLSDAAMLNAFMPDPEGDKIARTRTGACARALLRVLSGEDMEAERREP